MNGKQRRREEKRETKAKNKENECTKVKNKWNETKNILKEK